MLGIYPKSTFLYPSCLKSTFFDDFFSPKGANQSESYFDFDIDARDENGSIVIRADLPGVTKDNLNVTLEKGVLTISAKRETHTETVDGNVYLQECVSGNFRRSLRVPSDINGEDIKATLKDGVLQLTLVRKEEAKPRKIEII